jgi:transposase
MARSIVTEADEVVVGIDTHADVHVAVAISGTGARLGSISVPATRAGFDELLRWGSGLGRIQCFGVEGTGSYGATLTRHLKQRGQVVVEVDRPDRRTCRVQGKSDPVDAEAAARAVLAGKATGSPKTGDGLVEMIRALRVARRSAMKARIQAANQLIALVLTSPEGLRASLRGLPVSRLVDVAARFRPGPLICPEAAGKLAMRHLARRHAALSAEIMSLDRDLGMLGPRQPQRSFRSPGSGPTSPARCSSRQGTTRSASGASPRSLGSAGWRHCRSPRAKPAGTV